LHGIRSDYFGVAGDNIVDKVGISVDNIVFLVDKLASSQDKKHGG
jgi:hypothetical protein